MASDAVYSLGQFCNLFKLRHLGIKLVFFKETCHKFLSKINDPKIVTERLKKDIIKLVIDEAVIEGGSVKIFATIPLPNKIHEREMDKTDIPGPLRRSFSEASTFNAGATLGPVNETNMARIWNHSTMLMTSKHKQSNTPLKRKVFVGMSGGVDSSVAAALLKYGDAGLPVGGRGFDVTGVYIKCYNVDGCSERDAEDARRVAGQLDIPFYVFDFEEEYKNRVVQYMIDGYKKGITPNPDVMCNREIKFGLFLEKALALGADYVATGHYVRINKKTKKQRNKEIETLLFTAKDKNKDQSYFLWTLTQRQLKHCLFPIGEYKKPEVRRLAKKFGLVTAEKKDSQGICFLGQVDIKDFLKKYIPEKSGDVLDLDGRVIGQHKGAHFYTVGQRSGLNSGDWKRAGFGKRVKPFYVVSKDINKNTITVAVGDAAPELYKKEIDLVDINFISENLKLKTLNFKLSVLARVRYRQPLVAAKLYYIPHSAELGVYRLVFDKPVKYVAEGQSAVFYNSKGEMLGGGVIA